ncbi:hypothetical protein CR513_33883, partial [Mucuna pruriens]
MRGAKDSIEKGSTRRNLREIEEKGGKKKSLVERGEREDMRKNTTKKEEEGEGFRKAPMDALKCRIPPFIGDGDVEAYFD